VAGQLFDSFNANPSDEIRASGDFPAKCRALLNRAILLQIVLKRALHDVLGWG
jgi:hypothetical protein